jgi:hypothetical protein
MSPLETLASETPLLDLVTLSLLEELRRLCPLPDLFKPVLQGLGIFEPFNVFFTSDVAVFISLESFFLFGVCSGVKL